MTLPNFLIIGSHKSGTTSLYQYLRQHPDIFLPGEIKEARYFAYDENNPNHRSKVPKVFPVTTLKDYEKLFSDAGQATAIGEASPEYLNSTFAADRIKMLIPEARLIVSLRNPVDRAYSLYLMHLRNGSEDRTLEKAVEANTEWLSTGLYSNKLASYFDRFDKSQIKVILFDDLVSMPTVIMRELYKFLNVDENFTPDIATAHNVGGVIRNRKLHAIYSNRNIKRIFKSLFGEYIIDILRSAKEINMIKAPALSDDIRIKLYKLYEEDIKVLERLIDRDLSSWHC